MASLVQHNMKVVNKGFLRNIAAAGPDVSRKFWVYLHSLKPTSTADGRLPQDPCRWSLPDLHRGLCKTQTGTGISHNLSNVAKRYDVQVVFLAPNNLSKVCGLMNRKITNRNRKNGKRSEACHTSGLIYCKMGVVYELPVPCCRPDRTWCERALKRTWKVALRNKILESGWPFPGMSKFYVLVWASWNFRHI